MKHAHRETLELARVLFFSPFDERALFDWLHRIHCVLGVEGRGDTLFVTVDSGRMVERDLRELLAIHKRYGAPMAQLARFRRKEFDGWFLDQESYWWREVFAIKTTSRATRKLKTGEAEKSSEHEKPHKGKKSHKN
jgi:hypothetical protein